MQNVQGLGRNSVFRTSVADGDRGTAQTIPYAKQLIEEGMVDPDVRRLAAAYCFNVPANDSYGELFAIFAGVLNDFRFLKDPVGMQLLQPVAGLLETRSGNCASLNLILLPSLLGSIGYPTRAVTVKSDADRPKEFSHVYIEAQADDGRWIPLDVARSNPEFGKSPEYYWAKKIWPLTEGASAGAYLNGLGGHAMNRIGLGAGTVVIVKKRHFPRRGLGQDDGDTDTGDVTWQSPDGSLPSYGIYGAVASPVAAPTTQTPNYLSALPGLLTGVAQVVKAENTPGQPISGVVGAGTGVAGTGVGVGVGSGSVAPILLLLILGGFAVWAIH
jgi:hypothetical protein